MKKLGRLKLSDAKTMSCNEMKSITGGQQAYNSCKNIGEGSGFGSGDGVVCSGECPTVQPEATGSTGSSIKLKCEKELIRIGQTTLYSCICK